MIALSPSRLHLYSRCPQAYFFKYQCNLGGGAVFASAALGNALHRAFSVIYEHWHYQDSFPLFSWMETCWQQQQDGLSDHQVQEGLDILERYYRSFILGRVMRRPIAVEGQVRASFTVGAVEFLVTGRYDRLDLDEGGLTVIDYKSGKDLKVPAEVHSQLGLYCLALEERYGKVNRLRLIHLRSAECLDFEVSDVHREQVWTVMERLSNHLFQQSEWEPCLGSHCDRCAYRSYCKAVTPNPQPLPESAIKPQSLQLSLNL